MLTELSRYTSLDFEVVYYVTDPSYNLYMDVQQSINFELMTELAARGLDFALPARTIQVVSATDDQDARRPKQVHYVEPRFSFEN